MKIKFLGTSAGWPLPRLGCNCKVCSSRDARDTRTRSQALINETLLLDIGPDTYNHLKQLNLEKLLCAAITHEHPDHTFGLWDLSHLYNDHPKIKVIINENTFRKIRSLFFPGEYELVKVESEQKIKLEQLTVSLWPVHHTKESSFGILVEEGNKKFFWAPDFKSLPESTKKVLKNIDGLAIDGSELKVKTPWHQTIEEGILLGKGLEAKKVYFIHLGHRILPQQELEQFLLEKGGKQFQTAYDGLEVEI